MVYSPDRSSGTLGCLLFVESCQCSVFLVCLPFGCDNIIYRDQVRTLAVVLSWCDIQAIYFLYREKMSHVEISLIAKWSWIFWSFGIWKRGISWKGRKDHINIVSTFRRILSSNTYLRTEPATQYIVTCSSANSFYYTSLDDSFSATHSFPECTSVSFCVLQEDTYEAYPT